MNGKWFISLLLGFAVLFGAALVYFQNYAYYEEVTGLEEISFWGDPFPVSDYRGIDASTSPLKFRACFTAGWDYIETTDDKAKAEPLTAPHWFDCFDAESIAKDIAADKASAMRIGENDPDGFDTYIAHYPDGRVFMWRQLNAKYAEQ